MELLALKDIVLKKKWRCPLFMTKNIFNDLLILELANNHWGSVDRGKKIIDAFAKIARFHNVRCAIKLQIRHVETFIHQAFVNAEMKYIKKTRETALNDADYALLAQYIKDSNCIPMATPFDERSVQFCGLLKLPIIKLASSDINDWPLIEEVAKLKVPVIASAGGSSQKDMDDLVGFFEKRGIPLALNHCVANYPTEDSDLQLNQIDYLKERYPNITIGFSSHEFHNWWDSMLIAYGKGARTFERHVDIPYEKKDHEVSPYCSLPEQIDLWMSALERAKQLCGGTGARIPSEKEIQYLDALVRGMYAKTDLTAGHDLQPGDVYFAIPLQKKQLSCRELTFGEVLLADIKKDAPVMFDDVDFPAIPSIKEKILKRGF